MRSLFVLLLLANAAFLGVMQLQQGKGGGESMATHAPYRAESVRLITEEEVHHQPVQPPAPPAPVQVCMEWNLALEDLERAQSALKPLDLNEADVSVRKPLEKSSNYWVYIPPLKSRQEANKKVEELKALGIQDSFVMQDSNKWRHAVSLGVFSTEDAATKYLALVREKGVKSAKSAPRRQDASRGSLLIKASRANLEMDLVKLKQVFPGSDLKAVACEQ